MLVDKCDECGVELEYGDDVVVVLHGTWAIGEADTSYAIPDVYHSGCASV